jgi:MOSC domain-containing protein YiiM
VKIVSVNVGTPRDAVWRGEIVRTGIFKSPVRGSVAMHGHNLDGDAQADLTVHGGADKAVYGYPSEHYGFWRDWLGVAELPWGAFGENLTTEGLLEPDVCIGDRFRIGSALLEVSQPRIPCHKLALRHDRADLPKHFLASGRSGFYFRIAEPGALSPGDAIERVASDPQQLSVSDVQSLARTKGDPALIRRAIAHPALAAVWRDDLRKRQASRSEPKASEGR